MSSDHVVQVTPDHPPTASELYSSLPVLAGPDLIRVLDLSPLPPGSHNASPSARHSATCNVPLAGTLRIVKLTDSPKFAALSYTWGNERSSDHTLAISAMNSRGCPFLELNLTKNCHNALVHLRQQFGAMTIWVDSICINQQDNEEKSTQIPLMEQIYAWASPVYVWLGEGNARSDKAMDILSEISVCDKHLHTLERFLYSNENVWTRMFGFLRYLKNSSVQANLHAIRVWKTALPPWICSSSLCLSSYDAQCMVDLLASHQYNWSQRVWTLQELLMAGNIEVVCGSKTIVWQVFVRGLNVAPGFLHQDWTTDLSDAFAGGVHRWLSLASLWISFERPSKWNGRTKKYPSSDLKRSLGQFRWDICPHLLPGLVTIMAASLVIQMIVGIAAGRRALSLHFFLGWFLTAALACYVILYVVGRREWKSVKILDGKIPVSTGKQPRPIDSIMHEVRHRLSSDPKDKSFAMHGILRSFGVASSTPNYEKPLGVVFQELFSDLIAWNYSFIRFLMDAKMRRDPRMSHAPTWVPTFHNCNSSWLDPEYYNGTNHYSATSNNKLEASLGEGAASTDTRALARVDERFLRAAIQRHGTVISSSGAFSSMEGVENLDFAPQQQRENISKFLSWFFEMRIRTPCTPAYDSLSKAVFSVLEGRITVRPKNTNFNKWYRRMINLIVEAREFTKLTDGEFIHHAVEALESDPVVSRYFTRSCERLCSAERNLFVSSCGYLGSGPDNMVNGDVVALVPGVPVPMIFRDAQEESSQYTVVGPAFVHGLMKGEDWNAHRLEEVVLI